MSYARAAIWIALALGVSGCADSGADDGDADGSAPGAGDGSGGYEYRGPSFPSDGCGGDYTLPDGLESIEVDGVKRTYVLQVPKGYDPGKPYPIVFAFHGAGGFGASNIPIYNFKSVTRENAFLVHPDAKVDCPGSVAMPQWSMRDLPFFDAMYEAILSEYCIDKGRVFATGLSSGGGMSNILGCYRGKVVRAIAPAAGAGPFETCSGKVAVLQIHGKVDPLVPVAAAYDGQARWGAASGCDLAQSSPAFEQYTDRCVEFAGCDPENPVYYCEHLDPIGHTWPYFATKVVWDFFSNLEGVEPGESDAAGAGSITGYTVRFSIRVPSGFSQQPISMAVTLYPKGTKQPIFNMPLKILRDGLDPGELKPGAVIDYEVTGVSLSGLKLPGDYTFSPMVYVKCGGNPIPAAGKEHVGLYPIHLEEPGDITIKEVIELEPIRYTP